MLETDEETGFFVVRKNGLKFIEGQTTPFSGKSVLHYDDGTLYMRKTYKDGDDHGKRVGYDEFGNIDTISIWINGKIEGHVQMFQRGKLHLEGYYENGVRHGTWKKYANLDGVVTDYIYYKNGKCTGTSFASFTVTE